MDKEKFEEEIKKQEVKEEEEPEDLFLSQAEYDDLMEKKQMGEETTNEKPVNLGAEHLKNQNNSLFLLRDLRLCRIEHWLLLVPIISGIFIAIFSFFEVIPMFFNIISFALCAVTALGIYFYKKMNYMPNKEKRLVQRIYQSGQSFISCEKIKENKVTFGENAEGTVVTNLVSHIEGYSGQPLIVAYEGHYENLSISQIMKGLINPRSSSKVKAALDESYTKGIRDERMKNEALGKDIGNGVVLAGIGLIIIILVAYIVLFALPQTEILQAIQKGIEGLPAVVKSATVAVSSNAQVVDLGGA